MLDNGTKRRIDNARQVLVGKVPDPKAQVEQITTALIYKFMDDMDQEAVELGGKASFFTGDYQKFAWKDIMDRGLGGHQRLGLYAEALIKMSQNPNLPQLFRDIFKDAFLPYRDPETLNLFLKEINGFTYDHSERLGDAFEYLLSVLGSQGAAGQFRTPRHIIDFIVAAVNPGKDDSILDPACGTAGFLISAYKHILAKNKDKPLSPDEMQRLTENFVGYDISPEMVRLSLVNMYLHQFQNPTIFEYDTLTSEERWDDTFDVILANPPFMSPKGGIRPHKRFAVQAKRSEVLFVDYIASHLNPDGRAGIIVPEGIIFQSSNAYKNLRKMLIEEGYLYAVVSLPAGVFNPYSGVKTSILLLDRKLAKRTDQILFVNIQNDGFGLGAQRREIEENDFPDALQMVKEFQINPEGKLLFSNLGYGVSKSRISESGDFILSGGRYREVLETRKIKWPIVSLYSLCTGILSGGTPSTKVKEYWEGTIPWITSADIENLKSATPRRYITEKAINESATNLIPKNNVIVVTRVGLGKLFLNDFDVCISQDSQGLIINQNKVLPDYLVYILKTEVEKFKDKSQGTTIQGVTKKQLSSIQLPLPPLEVQREIVEEIEGYQKIIDGARMVVENYKPRIPIDPDWPLVELGEICEINPSKREVKDLDENILVSFVPMAYMNEHQIDFMPKEEKRLKDVYTGYTYFQNDDVLLARVTPCFENGKSGIAKNLSNSIGFGSSEYYVFRPHNNKVMSKWIYYHISDIKFINHGKGFMSGTSGLQRLTKDFVTSYRISLPSIKIQESIIDRINKEQRIVDDNKKLIKIFEQKIADKISEVWGETT